MFNFFSFLGILIFFAVVAMCDQVHDVENIFHIRKC